MSSASAPPPLSLSDAQILASQFDWDDSDVARFDRDKFQRRIAHNLPRCLHAFEYDGGDAAVSGSSVLCDFVGLMYESQQNLRAAEDFYRRAMRYDSANHVARINLARLVQPQGMIAPATLTPSVNDPHTRGVAWWSRAFYHMHMHQAAQAGRCFEQALECLPDERHLRLDFATSLNRSPKKQHHRRAGVVLKPLLHMQGTPMWQLRVLAEQLRASQNTNVVNTVVAKAHTVKQLPVEASSQSLLLRCFSRVLTYGGDAWRNGRKAEQAIQLYSDAIATHHATSHAYHNRGLLYRDAARFEDLETALELTWRQRSS